MNMRRSSWIWTKASKTDKSSRFLNHRHTEIDLTNEPRAGANSPQIPGTNRDFIHVLEWFELLSHIHLNYMTYGAVVGGQVEIPVTNRDVIHELEWFEHLLHINLNYMTCPQPFELALLVISCDWHFG
jgi:hypothetical protein